LSDFTFSECSLRCEELGESRARCCETNVTIHDRQAVRQDQVKKNPFRLIGIQNLKLHSFRGRGLTYGISMTVSVSEGRINLSFIRASHINNAFKEFRSMIGSFTNVSKLL